MDGIDGDVYSGLEQRMVSGKFITCFFPMLGYIPLGEAPFRKWRNCREVKGGIMKKILLLAAMVLVLASCIGIESTVSFNGDGSGVVVMNYRISKMLTEMGGEEAETPLPVTEEELRASLEEHPNLTVKSVTQTEDDNDILITTEVEFDRVEDFTDVAEFSEMPMNLEITSDGYIFTQVINEGAEEGAEASDPEEDAEMQAMMAQFFEGYELVFTVNAPAVVKEHNLGDLSSNGRSVTYAIPILDLSTLTEETVLTVRW